MAFSICWRHLEEEPGGVPAVSNVPWPCSEVHATQKCTLSIVFPRSYYWPHAAEVLPY